MQRISRSALATLVVVATIAGCGGDDSTSQSSAGAAGAASDGTGAAVAAPAAIKKAGKIVYCVDPTYPPVEFQQGSDVVGSDVDTGNEIAKRMGVEAQFTVVGFDAVIPAVNTNRCDAVISAMSDLPERAKQVDFVDYVTSPQQLMVPKDNPHNIKDFDDLGGLTVSVLVGTGNLDSLKDFSKQIEARGGRPIKIVTFPKDSDAASALLTNKVDAYASDLPGVAYYISKNPDKFTFGSEKGFKPVPWGIATSKKNSELHDAIEKAVKAMYADGSMQAILKKWNLSQLAMSNG